MRRSTRLEAVSGARAPRMSKLIAQHAQRVRQSADESEDEWKPNAEEEEASEGDAELSDSASSEEEMAKRRARATRANKRKIIDSDESDQEKKAKVGLRAKMKMKKVKRTTKMLATPPPPPPPAKTKQTAAQAVQKVAAAAKMVAAKRNGSAAHPIKVKDEVADPHRRPVKQQKRANMQVSADRRAQQTTVSYSGVPSNHTLDNFFDEILEWKFFEALRRETQGSHSYNTVNDGSEEGEVEMEVEIGKVPSKFRSYEHYFSVWKPMALEEVQAQTVNAVTTDHPNPIPVTIKGFGATFISKSCKIRVDPKKQNIPGLRRKNGWDHLNEMFMNDLVLLSPDQDYFRKALATSKGNHGVKSESKSEDTMESSPAGFLAIVATQRASKEGLTMTILRSGFGALEKVENIFLFKLNNLITSVREFRALCDCSHYKLLPLLLSGEHKEGTMKLDSLGLKYVQWLSKTFNESQREAITAAATSEGFTLIKGPPGTGKTTTLKGLLNSLHLREYNRYYNAVLDVARRPDNETAKAWAQVGNEKPHILVTAPSNAAVDNIVSKVIEEGFCDGEGRRYFPKIVRVGRGLSANVQSVGLENQVDQICSQPLDVLEGHIRRLRHELMVVERDSLILREQLRNIVAWIEHDPIKALEEIAQAEAQQIAHVAAETQAHPVPPPMELLPSSPPGQVPLSPSSPPPPSAYPDSPSPPPSPPGGVSSPKTSSTDMIEGGEVDIDIPEEEEEDEDFPASFGAPPPAWDEQGESFNAEASGKALNAFLDDGSNSEEDEPLPVPAKTDDQEEQDEPFPVTSHPETNAPSTQEAQSGDGSGTASQPIDIDDDAPEQDEPLPGQDSNAEVHEQVEHLSLAPEPPSLSIYHDGGTISSPHGSIPSSPPPPPPPLSPPPPPPLSPPPPIDLSDDHRPSSPTIVMPQSPRLPPPVALTTSKESREWGPIDYSRYQPYVAMAQRINGCLEKLSEVKLELQRYEFARQAVSEMRGKLSQSTRQSLEVSFLDTAHIVFTTLSSAGVAALDASHRYDVLVVDEAAQAVELSSIIPMKFGSKQCVLVGDPQQLSATVFSRNSGQSLYERSLFERLESCEHPVHMLRTQYRSHPMISDFPRNYFYDGKLQDGENVKGNDYVKPYHSLGPAFLPLVFWNLLSSREKTTKSVSRMNVGEAELAVNLYLTLKNSCPPDAIAGKVGMITPYSQQMEELRSRFRRTLGERYEQEVEINTVDGFQGREKDIIILSTVRADPKAGVGFLNDIRRMNVALTRAKFACYVIGKENTLRSSKPWSALLDHAYNHHCIVHVESPQCNLITLKPMERPAETPRNHSAGVPRNSHRQGPPQYDMPTPVDSQQSYGPSGNGWRGRGRGNDGSRGGRRGRGGRGRGNRGRGRGSPGQQYTPQQQFATSPGPQYSNQAPPSGYGPPPPRNMPMQLGGRPPAMNVPLPQPAPGYFAPRGPAPGFHPPPMQGPQTAGPYTGNPPAFSRLGNGTGGRGNINPRDPRQRAGRGAGPSGP